MKVFSLHRFIPTLLASFTLVLGACQDNGNSGTKPPEDEQSQVEVRGPTEEFLLEPIHPNDPRTVIPCEGELCYDPNDPNTKDRYNKFYNDMAPAPTSDTKPPETVEHMNEWREEFFDRLQQISDSFGACNYTQYRQDAIKVECPLWAHDVYDIYACPGHFFQIFGKDLPAILHVVDREMRTHYCLEGIEDKNKKQLRCSHGEVSTGALSTRWDNTDDYMPFCIAADLCMQLSEDEGIKGEDVCFYGDFTTADSGEIAPQDCESLEPGTCAINCPCGSAAEGADQGCQFLSEDNPVGICGLGSCAHAEDYRNCPLPSLSCAMPHVPTWVSAAVQNGPMEETPLGVCVEPSACEAWSETNDILDTCGTPGIILPDAP